MKISHWKNSEKAQVIPMIRKSGELLVLLFVSACKYGMLALFAQESGCGSFIAAAAFALSAQNVDRPEESTPAFVIKNHPVRRPPKNEKETVTMKKLIALLLSLMMLLSFAACTGEDVPETGGETVEFTFVAVDLEGTETTFRITTNKTIVGEALMDEGLIAGEEAEYGLYVKTVNGITLDYDADGKYWAFYVDGEYGMTGVDQTEIVPGSTYTFKPE